MSAQLGTPPSPTHISSVPLCIKNTFIEVEEPASQQRFSSLPPSLRLSGGGCRPRAMTTGNRCASPLKDRTSSPSSRAPDTDEEVSTEADTSEAGEDTNSEAEAASTGEDDKVASLVEPPPAPQSRLNSRARLWTPGASAAMVPRQLSWEEAEFTQKLKGVAAAVHAVLINCFYVGVVEATESHLGWNIIARLLPRDCHQKETTLTLAKQAIISASEVSSPLYVLGYSARPFVDTVGGFSARFVGVSDEHNACWGLLQQGFCRYGEACRWRHPTYQTTINVAVVIADL